jgi:hypothetical protein
VERAVAFLIAATLAGGVTPIAAQRGTRPDTVKVAAGPDYGAGPLHRFLLGGSYRDLWTTPIAVPVLDLATFGGGLMPSERGGGMQTKSLHFVAPDGKEYTFRSVDKDPSSILPPELRETLVEDVVQDQISSAHPVGALLVAPILEAVGVLHAEPVLARMPDDPRLGEFREEFAGILGTIEERPDEVEGRPATFEGADNIVGTERLLERIQEDLERIDTRAFLAARLIDIFLGDWDRHRDQWRWARFGDDPDDLWQPIPRDRDQAFVRMDGALLALARQYYPQLVKFNASYPSILGVTWNGRELDRRFLVDLERPTWDSVATSLQAKLTNEAIDRAVAQLPEEYGADVADELRQRLQSRRDDLIDMSMRFYEFLATEVDVQTSDAPEIVTVEHGEETLDVVVTAFDSTAGQVELFRRRFLEDETKELRLFLHGGADTIRTTGRASDITVRVVGGSEPDHLEDSAGGTHFYAADDGDAWTEGPGTVVDRREWTPPETPPSQPARDWGSTWRYPLWGGFAPNVGLLVGMGFERYDYGFRTLPWASRLKIRAAFATTALTYRIDAQFQKNRENSPHYWVIDARASGLDILNFHGFGNETELDQPDPEYEVELNRFSLDPRYVFVFREALSLAVGPTLAWSRTTEEGTQLIDVLRPYGTGDFGSVGMNADVQFDGRDRARSPTSGVFLEAGATAWPAAFSVEEAFAEARISAAAYLSPWQPMQPTLAIRVGAEQMFGTYPFQEAAFLGDQATVRLGRPQRYAGDAQAHANAELRTRVGSLKIVIPADIGILGLTDIGRVWYEDEGSDTWHHAYGGGIWLGFLGPENALSFTVAKSAERTGLYILGGFAW